tara:strand:- start:216 stop:593 length:378 start_codon:yes stop_codon:yes gene_type:complete
MSQGLNMTGLPMAPSEKQVLKAGGYLGDAMVIVSPLAGPFAPAVAGVGSVISTTTAVGTAMDDLAEGNKDKVVTDAVIQVGTEVVSRALKLDKVEPIVDVIKAVRITLYTKVIIPKIIEEVKKKD